MVFYFFSRIQRCVEIWGEILHSWITLCHTPTETGTKQQESELSGQQKIGTLQLCNSFYSPLCWKVKWNYLGGSSYRNWAQLGSVPGFLSWTGVTGFSPGWHKGGTITPAAPAEGAQENWVPGIGQDNDCHRYQIFIYLCKMIWFMIFCVWTPLRTLLLTTGGAAGCLWLWIINDQGEGQHRQTSENLAF